MEKKGIFTQRFRHITSWEKLGTMVWIIMSLSCVVALSSPLSYGTPRRRDSKESLDTRVSSAEDLVRIELERQRRQAEEEDVKSAPQYLDRLLEKAHGIFFSPNLSEEEKFFQIRDSILPSELRKRGAEEIMTLLAEKVADLALQHREHTAYWAAKVEARSKQAQLYISPSRSLPMPADMDRLEHQDLLKYVNEIEMHLLIANLLSLNFFGFQFDSEFQKENLKQNLRWLLATAGSAGGALAALLSAWDGRIGTALAAGAFSGLAGWQARKSYISARQLMRRRMLDLFFERIDSILPREAMDLARHALIVEGDALKASLQFAQGIVPSERDICGPLMETNPPREATAAPTGIRVVVSGDHSSDHSSETDNAEEPLSLTRKVRR